MRVFVRTVIKIGSISDLWSKAIERVTGIPSEGEKRPPRYRIWFDPSIRGGSKRSDAENGNRGMNEVVPPEGMEFQEAREEDIPIVSSSLPLVVWGSHLPYLHQRIDSLVFYHSSSSPSVLIPHFRILSVPRHLRSSPFPFLPFLPSTLHLSPHSLFPTPHDNLTRHNSPRRFARNPFRLS